MVSGPVSNQFAQWTLTITEDHWTCCLQNSLGSEHTSLLQGMYASNSFLAGQIGDSCLAVPMEGHEPVTLELPVCHLSYWGVLVWLGTRLKMSSEII